MEEGEQMMVPLVAVPPGVWNPWVRVDTQAVGSARNGEVLAIHVARYPVPDDASNDHLLPGTLNLHTLATAPMPFRVLQQRLKAADGSAQRFELERQNTRQERMAQNAATVVIGQPFGDPPEFVLGTMMRRYIFANAIGVQIDDETCLVGMRTRQPPGTRQDVDEDPGFTVTMTGGKGAPAPLFPSALEGWARWWRHNAREIRERAVSSVELPPPPSDLTIVEAFESHHIQVDYYKRTAWPQLPLIPRFDFGDDHI
ncbi:hypothetical protein [Streptomyces sp. NPDC056682]|uniref:hypothetical protein n=1 Tax=Streptomyces sp. NPDC056682 TaxID=3345909 RepID=UPI0036A76B1A